MMALALTIAAFTGAPSAGPIPVSHFDLGAFEGPTLTTRHAPRRAKRRSRYLLPEAELPDQDEPGVEIKWKLKTIKLKMPLPSI